MERNGRQLDIVEVDHVDEFIEAEAVHMIEKMTDRIAVVRVGVGSQPCHDGVIYGALRIERAAVDGEQLREDAQAPIVGVAARDERAYLMGEIGDASRPALSRQDLGDMRSVEGQPVSQRADADIERFHQSVQVGKIYLVIDRQVVFQRVLQSRKNLRFIKRNAFFKT